MKLVTRKKGSIGGVALLSAKEWLKDDSNANRDGRSILE